MMFKITIKKNSTQTRGFTLVELLVASSIFSSVLVIAIGALFSAQAINTRIQETQAILDGVNLATEVISRDIRYGSEFHCGTGVPESQMLLDYAQARQGCLYGTSGGAALIFKPTGKLSGSLLPAKDRISYSIELVPFNGTTTHVIVKKEFPGGDINASSTYQVTPTDVDITSFVYYVDGALASTGGVTDNNQPLITMSISGVTIPSKKSVAPVTFNLQVTSASRNIDN